MFRFRSIVPALGVLTIALAASAGSLHLLSDPKPAISFATESPEEKITEISIKGSFNKLSVEDDGSTLTLKSALSSISTGIALRDTHSKKELGVPKGDDVTLVIDKSKLKIPEDGKSAKGSAPGKLTIHANTKAAKSVDVTVGYEVERKGSDLIVKGWTSFNMKTAGMTQPCFSGVCAAPLVKLRASFKLREK